MAADTRAVMAVAGVGVMAVASMAHPSLFGRVRAAIGLPTADASAGGDIGPIVRLRRDRRQDSGVPGNRRAFFFGASIVGALNDQPSRIATARVQPAEARSILTGKHDTMKPVAGNCSRLCNFSMWQ